MNDDRILLTEIAQTMTEMSKYILNCAEAIGAYLEAGADSTTVNARPDGEGGATSPATFVPASEVSRPLERESFDD